MTVMQAARPLPAWADAELSSDLPRLCAKGEGQALEFKLDLPPQSHDIAKSIAAFASSNEGLLIYGVSDDGRIVGLPEAGNSKWRDRTQQPLLSAAKEIKPPVHPIVRWACVDGRIACVVKVEKSHSRSSALASPGIAAPFETCHLVLVNRSRTVFGSQSGYRSEFIQ